MFASLNPGHIGVKAGFPEGLALAETHGFAGFDAQLQPLHEAVTREGAATVRQRFVDHGLRPGCWNLPYMPYRVSAEEHQDWLRKLPPLLASAAAVGAHRAGMWILPGSNDRTYDDNFAFHVERFQPVAKLLADHGIRLGLEFVGPLTSLRRFAHPFIHSLSPTLELARAIGPNVGLLFDSWHWHCSGGDPADLKALTQDNLVHIHVNDAPAGLDREALIDNQRRLPLTTGVIDLAAFIRAVHATGYDGPVTAEPFDSELNALPPEDSLRRTATATRSAVALAG
ncbi:MAG: sugar phosphate isomerase/epimerase [Puniceicoccaceae bacterium]|nr:MAG: sugar phosphate isomerase/epimerase [Puniceicoccaceae bacterium]